MPCVGLPGRRSGLNRTGVAPFRPAPDVSIVRSKDWPGVPAAGLGTHIAWFTEMPTLRQVPRVRTV